MIVPYGFYSPELGVHSYQSPVTSVQARAEIRIDPVGAAWDGLASRAVRHSDRRSSSSSWLMPELKGNVVRLPLDIRKPHVDAVAAKRSSRRLGHPTYPPAKPCQFTEQTRRRSTVVSWRLWRLWRPWRLWRLWRPWRLWRLVVLVVVVVAVVRRCSRWMAE